MAKDDNTQQRGLKNASEETRERVASEGGKASAKSKTGSAGSTNAAREGGEHSHGGGRQE